MSATKQQPPPPKVPPPASVVSSSGGGDDRLSAAERSALAEHNQLLLQNLQLRHVSVVDGLAFESQRLIRDNEMLLHAERLERELSAERRITGELTSRISEIEHNHGTQQSIMIAMIQKIQEELWTLKQHNGAGAAHATATAAATAETATAATPIAAAIPLVAIPLAGGDDATDATAAAAASEPNSRRGSAAGAPTSVAAAAAAYTPLTPQKVRASILGAAPTAAVPASPHRSSTASTAGAATATTASSGGGLSALFSNPFRRSSVKSSAATTTPSTQALVVTITPTPTPATNTSDRDRTASTASSVGAPEAHLDLPPPPNSTLAVPQTAPAAAPAPLQLLRQSSATAAAAYAIAAAAVGTASRSPSIAPSVGPPNYSPPANATGPLDRLSVANAGAALTPVGSAGTAGSRSGSKVSAYHDAMSSAGAAAPAVAAAPPDPGTRLRDIDGGVYYRLFLWLIQLQQMRRLHSTRAPVVAAAADAKAPKSQSADAKTDSSAPAALEGMHYGLGVNECSERLMSLRGRYYECLEKYELSEVKLRRSQLKHVMAAPASTPAAARAPPPSVAAATADTPPVPVTEVDTIRVYNDYFASVIAVIQQNTVKEATAAAAAAAGIASGSSVPNTPTLTAASAGAKEPEPIEPAAATATPTPAAAPESTFDPLGITAFPNAKAVPITGSGNKPSGGVTIKPAGSPPNPSHVPTGPPPAAAVAVSSRRLPTAAKPRPSRAVENVSQTIRIDVERTYADDPYFASFDTRIVLQRVLLIWSAEHPHVSYRQGMNELLAMIIIALRKDHSRPPPKETYPLELALLADQQFMEHDSYTIFCLLMDEMLPFYSAAAFNRDPSNAAGQQSVLYNKLHAIHNVLLKAVDTPLYDHLQHNEVLPQLYLLRWVRVLFTREFDTDRCLTIWDWLFAAASGDVSLSTVSAGRPSLFDAVTTASPAKPPTGGAVAVAPPAPPLDILIDYVCIGMISYIRFEVLDASVSHMVLTKLMRYPQVTDVQPILAVAEQLLRRGPPTTTTIAFVEHRHTPGRSGTASVSGIGSSPSAASVAAAARAGRGKPQRTKTQQNAAAASDSGTDGVGAGNLFGTFTRLMFGDSNKAAIAAAATTAPPHSAGSSSPATTSPGSATPTTSASAPVTPTTTAGHAHGGAVKPEKEKDAASVVPAAANRSPALTPAAAAMAGGALKLVLDAMSMHPVQSPSPTAVAAANAAASSRAADRMDRSILQTYAAYAARSTAQKTCGYLLKRGNGKRTLGRASINKRWFILRSPYLSYYVSHQKAAAGEAPIKQSRIDLRGRVIRIVDANKFHFEIGAAPPLPPTAASAAAAAVAATALAAAGLLPASTAAAAAASAPPPTASATPRSSVKLSAPISISSAANAGAGTSSPDSTSSSSTGGGWTEVRKEDSHLAKEAEERERVYELFASDESAMNHWVRALQEASEFPPDTPHAH